MKKENRRYLASWMLVPVVLAVPAFISGLSILHGWGPHWLLLSMAITTGLLALIIHHEHALIGAVLGLATYPILLLFLQLNWVVFAWWVAAGAMVTALLLPPIWETSGPPRNRRAARDTAPADAENTMERLLSTTSQQPKL